MCDTTVRCPVARHFEKGVNLGLIVHKSPFMADEKDPLVLSNYIFDLLEVNLGVALHAYVAAAACGLGFRAPNVL